MAIDLQPDAYPEVLKGMPAWVPMNFTLAIQDTADVAHRSTWNYI